MLLVIATYVSLNQHILPPTPLSRNYPHNNTPAPYSSKKTLILATKYRSPSHLTHHHQPIKPRHSFGMSDLPGSYRKHDISSPPNNTLKAPPLSTTLHGIAFAVSLEPRSLTIQIDSSFDVVLHNLSEKQILQTLGYMSRGRREVTLVATIVRQSFSLDATSLKGLPEYIWNACGDHVEEVLRRKILERAM